MISYDQLKYPEFQNNPQKWLQNVKVTNFDIMHNKCRKDHLKNPVQEYKTVSSKNFKSYPDHEKEKAMNFITRSVRKDI